jgi:hypothetical protein
VTGLIQNHSGNGYVGAPIWDLHDLTKDFDPKHFGVHFDIGHATVESGLSWPTSFALVKDRVAAVIVKDFYWKHTPGQGAKEYWVPLGQGSIHPGSSACSGVGLPRADHDAVRVPAGGRRQPRVASQAPQGRQPRPCGSGWPRLKPHHTRIFPGSSG